MNWIKKGLIFKPTGDSGWNQKYAIAPTPIYLESEGLIRIFYGSTDNQNNGRVSYIDVLADDPSSIAYICDHPVLDVGRAGTFDDCGVVPTCVIWIEALSKYYMYTCGFQRTQRTPYMIFAGLAESKDCKEFTRTVEYPILSRSENRCISQGAPCVIYEEGQYKMWHWYGTEWIEVDEKWYMDYRIGYAVSSNGKEWKMYQEPCLEPDRNKGEFAVARPWVFKDGNIYCMYYCTRYEGRLYRLSFATSNDGLHWNKQQEVPFDVSLEGWDSEMICYPSIVEAGGKRYMFYNGNNNGETGFGYAEELIK